MFLYMKVTNDGDAETDFAASSPFVMTLLVLDAVEKRRGEYEGYF